MYLSASDDNFFVTESKLLWGDDINPVLKPPYKLEQEIQDGIDLYAKLFPPRKKSLMKLGIFVLIVLSAGAATMAMGGVGAGAGAVTASAAGPVTSAVTIGGTGTLTTSSAMGMIKTGAGYLTKGAAVYSKLTGKETPAELMAAADAIENSGSFVDAGKKAFNYYLNERGQKITDKKTQQLIEARLVQEQRAQVKRLRDMAAKKQVKQQQQNSGFTQYLPIVVPLVFVLLKGL